MPHRVVTISARPNPIEIDPAKAAMIVVDMQNDFAAKGGLFDRAGSTYRERETLFLTFSRASRQRDERAFQLSS